MPKIITESDLVLPALRALVDSGERGVTTEMLQRILRKSIVPQNEDLILLEGRTDDRFSQKVRNLKSHNRLERDGLATYNNGVFLITAFGKKFVERFSGVDEGYNDQGFTEPEKMEAMKPTKNLIFVEEGHTTKVNASIRRRSRRLQQYAISSFSKADGTISCKGCGFEGTNIYGEQGKGLIDIHHLKPIALSGETKKPLSEAIKNLVPLCPNCHRLVHRERNTVMPIRKLKELIGTAK